MFFLKQAFKGFSKSSSDKDFYIVFDEATAGSASSSPKTAIQETVAPASKTVSVAEAVTEPAAQAIAPTPKPAVEKAVKAPKPQVKPTPMLVPEPSVTEQQQKQAELEAALELSSKLYPAFPDRRGPGPSLTGYMDMARSMRRR